MANYTDLKAAIAAAIYENGVQKITGDVLQAVLLDMTGELGAFSQFGGVATPATNPGENLDANVIYLAVTPGLYASMGGYTVQEGEIALLAYDGAWHKNTLPVLSNTPGMVDTENIADGAIDSNKIIDGGVTTGKIAGSAVTSAKLADGAVTSDKLGDGAISSAKLASGAVSADKIQDGAVTSGKLANGAVTETKIQDGAVSGGKLENGAVTGTKIANGTIPGGKLENGAIDTPQVADGAVTGAKIADGGVTTAKIADGAVTGGKIADGAVSFGKLADSAKTKAEPNAQGGVDIKQNGQVLATLASEAEVTQLERKLDITTMSDTLTSGAAAWLFVGELDSLLNGEDIYIRYSAPSGVDVKALDLMNSRAEKIATITRTFQKINYSLTSGYSQVYGQSYPPTEITLEIMKGSELLSLINNNKGLIDGMLSRLDSAEIGITELQNNFGNNYEHELTSGGATWAFAGTLDATLRSGKPFFCKIELSNDAVLKAARLMSSNGTLIAELDSTNKIIDANLSLSEYSRVYLQASKASVATLTIVPFSSILDAAVNNSIIADIRKSCDIEKADYSKMTKVVVKKDGSGDFTTIQDAINACYADASPTNQYDIQVCDDFYITSLLDLYNVGYGVNTKNTKTTPTTHIALVVTHPYCHIRGVGRRRTLFVESPSDLASSAFQYVQTIYAQGTCIISDFNVIVKGGRYAIHQESGGDVESPDHNAFTIYRNLLVQHLGNSMYPNGSGWTSVCAQANGMCSGLKMLYENVVWTSRHSVCFYCHTNQNFSMRNEVTFRNCEINLVGIKNHSVGVNWTDLGSGHKALINLDGCKFPIFKFEDGGQLYENSTNSIWFDGGAEVVGNNNDKLITSWSMPNVLHINSTTNGVSVDVVGGTAFDDVWGGTKRTGVDSGITGYAEGLQRIDDGTRFSLGARLGDCTTTNKTLIVSVGGVSQTILLNMNYTSLSNENVVADINAKASNFVVTFKKSSGVDSSNWFRYYKYNMPSDCIVYATNLSANNWEVNQPLVKDYSLGSNGWRIANNGEKALAICGESIPKGQCGNIVLLDKVRVLNGTTQGTSLYTSYAVGDMYKANNGYWAKTTNPSEASLIAIDDSTLELI